MLQFKLVLVGNWLMMNVRFSWIWIFSGGRTKHVRPPYITGKGHSILGMPINTVLLWELSIYCETRGLNTVYRIPSIDISRENLANVCPVHLPYSSILFVALLLLDLPSWNKNHTRNQQFAVTACLINKELVGSVIRGLRTLNLHLDDI